ncbi:Hypothetical protein, putative [Bodo saltans]|uniref:Uncharacterized protein n=1 Tax=Bodo saltans TaxID=75058 RepID=A0A0S4JW68_BODSA|nr:Hypothetical protein, putative [Bodo saltans]|eukprot:CUG94468.1 Hypothetical protein, putative [Bodo saltans]
MRETLNEDGRPSTFYFTNISRSLSVKSPSVHPSPLVAQGFVCLFVLFL